MGIASLDAKKVDKPQKLTALTFRLVMAQSIKLLNA